MSSKQLIDMFVDIVTCSGNMLLMVNLDGNGALPEIQEKRLREIGRWLKINGEGIYATRPYCSAQPDGTSSSKAVMTQSKDGRFVYLILKEWPGAYFSTSLVEPLTGSKITMLGQDGALEWSKEKSAVKVQLPEGLKAANTRTGQHAWVLKIESSNPAP